MSTTPPKPSVKLIETMWFTIIYAVDKISPVGIKPAGLIMDFDEIIKLPFENEVIEYGIIKGNDTVAFFKAGANGSMRGYNDKYLTIGSRLHEKYGYTIVCSSNPYAQQDSIGQGIDVIERFVNKPYQVYYMGHSNGALQGARAVALFPQIKSVLLVNGPLIINLHKTGKILTDFKGERAALIYGGEDPSVKFLPLLIKEQTSKLFYDIIPGADHNFMGKLEEFESLFEKYLVNETYEEEFKYYVLFGATFCRFKVQSSILQTYCAEKNLWEDMNWLDKEQEIRRIIFNGTSITAEEFEQKAKKQKPK